MAGPVDTVNVIDAHGNVVALPPAQAAQALQADQTLRLESAPESQTRAADTAAAAPYQGAAGTVLAGLSSAASGATLGGSDALLSAIGGDDTRHAINASRAANPTLSTGANIAGAIIPIALSGGAAAPEAAAELGTLGVEGAVTAGRAAEAGGSAARAIAEAMPTSLASGAGQAITKSLGGGLVARVAGGAAEGGLFGAGNAVSQLALSDDPLTVDHVLSTLSSNVLLGAGAGGLGAGAFALGEKALLRAADKLAEATAARAAIEGAPAELANLDVAGLKAARESAVAEQKAAIAAEHESLEALRGPQREEMVSQVKELADNIGKSGDRPIYHALTGDDARSLPGMGDSASQLNKSFKAIRAITDNPLAAAESPGRLIAPLQLRQTALEGIQARMPELQATLAGDARSGALAHVDDVLLETKQQIASLRSLDSKTNPVMSERLAFLKAGDSPKVQAIDAATEALKKAPEIGLLAKGAKAAAFAGGTALAHLIPGAGIAAPFVGKYAADAVGKLFGHLATGVEGAAAKSAAAAKAFLGVGERLAPLAPSSSTKVLAAARFGHGPEPKSDKLADVFTARSAELRAQTMYAPDGSIQMRQDARLTMAKKLDPIRAVNPILADKVETAAAARTVYLSSKIPRRPDTGGIQFGPDKWHPSDMEMRSFARTVRACEDPHGVEQRLALGALTPEDADAYRACYPERFKALQQAIITAAPKLEKSIPMSKHVALSILFGSPTTVAMQPNMIAALQATFTVEPGSAGGTKAPGPQPNFGRFGSVKDVDKPTPSQAREGA